MENEEQRNGDLYSLVDVSLSEIEVQTNVVRLLNVMKRPSCHRSTHLKRSRSAFECKPVPIGNTYPRQSTNRWRLMEDLPAFSLTLQIRRPALDSESWGRCSRVRRSHGRSLQIHILDNRRVLFWGKVLEGDGIRSEVVTED